MCGRVYEQRSARSVRQPRRSAAGVRRLTILAASIAGWKTSLTSDVIGDHDLLGNQTVEFQQQAVRVLLIIEAQGRAESFDLFLDDAKLVDGRILGMHFDGIQDGGDGNHRWLPFIAEKKD